MENVIKRTRWNTSLSSSGSLVKKSSYKRFKADAGEGIVRLSWSKYCLRILRPMTALASLCDQRMNISVITFLNDYYIHNAYLMFLSNNLMFDEFFWWYIDEIIIVSFISFLALWCRLTFKKNKIICSYECIKIMFT